MQPSLPDDSDGRGVRRWLLLMSTAVALLGLGVPLMLGSEREARAADSNFAADSIVGQWWTENKQGRIRFVKREDGTYQGQVTWGAEPRQDRFNKNPKLRDRSIVGMVLVWHLVYSDAKYADGYIYNPEDGGTYRVKAWLTSADTLQLRGYLGISLLGQTQTWTRYR